MAPADDANPAAAKTTMITQGDSPSAETTAQSLDDSAGVNTSAVATAADKPADVKGRKITPAPATDKKAGKNKAKQQRTLASFFTKSKVPPTPHAGAAPSTKTAKPKSATTKSKTASVAPKDSEKQAAKDATAAKPQKKKPATKKASASANSTAVTPGTNASTPAAALANSAAVLHNKMDFKDVIVGNLSSKSSAVRAKPKSPVGATDDAKLVDSLLPRIPPVSAVQPPVSQQKERSAVAAAKQTKATPGPSNSNSDKTATTTQDNSIKSSPSRDESESGSIEMGAVKSQLVHLFENPPADAGNSIDVEAKPTKEVGEKNEASETDPGAEADDTEQTKEIQATKEDVETKPVKEAGKIEQAAEEEQVEEKKEVVEVDAAKKADEVVQAAEKEEARATTEKAIPATTTTTTTTLEISPETDGVEEPASSSSDVPKMKEQDPVGEPMEVCDENKESAVASSDTTSGNSKEESKDLDKPTVTAESKAGGVSTDAEQSDGEKNPSKQDENKVLVPITLGAIFVKKFGNLGYFVGKVTALPTKDDDFYSVFYEADGDKEQLTEKQLSRLLNTGPSKKKRKEIEQGIGDPHRVGPVIKSSATAAATPTVKHFFGPSSASKTGTKKAVVSKTKATVTPQAAAPIVQLNAEMQALLTKHQGMKASHIEKAKHMLEQGRNNLDSSGDDQVILPSTENISISGAVTEFPDAAVPHLLVLLEGR